MKKLAIIFLLGIFLLGIVSAMNYEGDGTYVLNKGDTIIADNGYKLQLHELTIITLGSVNQKAIYSFYLYEKDKKIDEFSFDAYNFDTLTYLINSSNGEPAVEITFVTKMNPKESEVTFKSLLFENQKEVQKENFLKRFGNWFKCLFSKKC